jgi:hypothetical protein
MSLAAWFPSLVDERSVRLLAEIAGVIVTLWLQAAVLLLLALVVRRWIRLPALRVTLAWATVAGLSVLPVLVWLPGWRVLSLMPLDVTDVVAGRVINVAAVPAVPVPVEASSEPVAVEDRAVQDWASKAVPVPASVVTIDPVTDNLTNTAPPLAEATLPGPDSTLAEAASEAVAAAVPTLGEGLLDPADAELATPELVTTESASDTVPALPSPNLVATPPSGSPPNAPPAMQASAPSPVLTADHRGRMWIHDAAPVVLVAASVMAGLVLVWSCLGGWFVSRLLWRSRPAGEDLLAELDAVRSATPGRRGPRLLISSEVSVPAAVGTWRPTILLPEMVLDDESRPAVRAALRHELAHIERGDLWLLCWSRWLSPVYATQPLWWLFRGAMRVDQELTADAMAAGDDPVGYAEALVGWAKAIHREVERRSWLGQSWLGRTWLGRAWGRMGRPEFQLSDSPGSLTRRVAMLLDPRRMFSGRISRWMKAGLVLLLLGWTVCASLIAVTEPGSAGAWWQAVWGQGYKDAVGQSTPDLRLVAETDERVFLPATARVEVLGNTVTVAQTPVLVEVPAAVTPPKSRPAARGVQLDCVVGWIDDERVSAATGATRLILPEGPTEALPQGRDPTALALWLKSSDLQFRMKLARESSLVKILGEPTLVTVFNQQGDVFTGGELPQLKVVERRNGAVPPGLPESSAVPIGLLLQATVSDTQSHPDPFQEGGLGTIDVRVSWSSKRDETTVDRQVLSGRVDWSHENRSLFLTEQLPEQPNTAETPRQRLFAVITPRIVDRNELVNSAPFTEFNKEPGFDPLALPPLPAGVDENVTPPTLPAAAAVAPAQRTPAQLGNLPAVALPQTAPNSPPAPPVTVTFVPPPSSELVPDVQYFRPGPTAKPVVPASALRVKVRKLTWNTEDPKWVVNKGKPEQETFPLNPARTWSILPFAPGDLGCVLMPTAFHVPLRRDFDAILVEQQQLSRAKSAPSYSEFSPAGQANTEYSQPVENGIARLAFPEPLFQTVVVQPEVSPFYGSGSAALDVVVRPEYGLMSDGSPGLKGYSGVLRMGAMLDAEIGAKHADLTPSRLAKMLLNRGVPMLCPFQVPPGGGLIVCQLPSSALNLDNGNVDDDMNRTALFISFESTLDEDNSRRFAEMQMEYRRNNTSPDTTGAQGQSTAPTPPHSLGEARTELQRLLGEYPQSRTPLADLWQAIIEYEMASLRERVARLSVEPPNVESPQERISRLESQAAPLMYQLMMMDPLVAWPERTSAKTFPRRFPDPIAPQYLEELKAMVKVVSQRGEQVEALRKSLNDQSTKPSPQRPATGAIEKPAPAPQPVKPPGTQPATVEPKEGKPEESPSAAPAVKPGDSPQDDINPESPPLEKPAEASAAEPDETKEAIPPNEGEQPAPATNLGTDQAASVDSSVDVRVKVQRLRWPSGPPSIRDKDDSADRSAFSPMAMRRSLKTLPMVPGEPVRVLDEVYGVSSPDRLVEMFGQITPESDALIGEWSFPAVRGVAQLACPLPVLNASVLDASSALEGPRVAERGVMAVDLVVRPEYGLLSDGQPGLKGYSGVLVASASTQSPGDAAKRIRDLPPDKVADALRATDLPSLCSFELPPDGALMIRSPFLETLWHSDRTVLLVTFESTRNADEERRNAEVWLAARSRAIKAAMPQTDGDAASTETPTSIVGTGDELRRFLRESPTSTNSLAELREAIARLVLVRMRKLLVEYSPYGPDPSPSARLERLARMDDQHELALQWFSPFIAAAERESEPFTGALSSAIAPELLSELKRLEEELRR